MGMGIHDFAAIGGLSGLGGGMNNFNTLASNMNNMNNMGNLQPDMHLGGQVRTDTTGHMFAVPPRHKMEVTLATARAVPGLTYSPHGDAARLRVAPVACISFVLCGAYVICRVCL